MNKGSLIWHDDSNAEYMEFKDPWTSGNQNSNGYIGNFIIMDIIMQAKELKYNPLNNTIPDAFPINMKQVIALLLEFAEYIFILLVRICNIIINVDNSINMNVIIIMGMNMVPNANDNDVNKISCM